MKNVKILIVLFMVAAIVACKTSKKNVDVIIHNAQIYSVDSAFTVAQSLAIKEGKFVALGSNNEILGKYYAPEIIDLQGKVIYPGFHDAHCHFYGYAKDLLYADLTGCTSFEEVITRLKIHRKEYPTGWLVGFGWDQNLWAKKEFPDNTLLEKEFSDIPILITRIDGHAVLASSNVLKIAGFSTSTKISGGVVQQQNNKLTGIALDNAADKLKELIPQPTQKELISLLIKAQDRLLAVGLTCLTDAGLDKNIVMLIDSLQKKGILKIRLNCMLTPTPGNIDYFVKKGVYKTEMLRVGSIKMYADGALGSRGAKLIEPYSDMPQSYGISVNNADSLKKIAELAKKNNYQICTHAIGDAGVRMVLAVYSSLLQEKNDLRWRIEHCQVVAKEDFPLFAKYAIIPSVNAVHATSDMKWAANRLGKDRVKYAYAYKNLLQQNGWLCNGSDFPIENINPLFGFYAAVTRQDQSGFPPNGFQKENAITNEQALKSMTIWAARAAFLERETGSIEPNKFADFVVLDKDILTCDARDIYKAKVLMTYISGKRVK